MADEVRKVLIIDDEEAMREVLRSRLQNWGFEVSMAGDVAGAERSVADETPWVVISDVMLPDGTGVELLERLRSRHPRLPVILITAHGSVDLAVEAMKLGARDFLTKPLKHDQLRSILEELRAEALVTGLPQDDETGFGPFIGRSPAMQDVYEALRRFAPSDATALITGESGTGKEIAARALHDLGKRSGQPFVAINTAAIPSELMESELFGHEKGAFTGATAARAGCFEQADGGTLFLDEISEMPAALQPKLLRVLEDGVVRRVGGSRELHPDVRVIAATNRDPRAAIDEDRLREDLFYRLNVVTLELPPLRERSGDVPLLATHFLAQANERHGQEVTGLDPDAVALLEAYDWPGNVRELRNIVERGVVIAGRGPILPTHLPPYLRSTDRQAPRPATAEENAMTLAEAEKRLILETLEQTGNNKAEAARRLGIDVKTVRNKLKTWESEAD